MTLPNRPNGERSLFISDLHAPNHDPLALLSLLPLCREWRPHKLFLVGDIWDCEHVSRHGQPHDLKGSLQEDIDAGVNVVGEIIRACGKPEVHFLYGNHEVWWLKWLATHGRQASSLRSLQMDALFRMAEIGVTKTYPYGDVVLYRGAAITHGDIARSAPGATAKAMLDRHYCSGLLGHVHRLARVEVHKTGGDFWWVENGCLCRLDPGYAKGGEPDWQHGFSVGFTDARGRFTITPVPIHARVESRRVHHVST